VANRLSDLLANIYPSSPPALFNDVNLAFAQVKFCMGTISVLAADADAIIYPVFRVLADWRLIDLWVFNDAITSGTDYDIGLYNAGNWNLADQTVRDKDIWCDGLTMATARNFGVSVDPSIASRALSDDVAATGSGQNVLGRAMASSASITGIQRFRRVWEDAGLSAAPTPGTEFDVCVTANTVGSLAGTIKVAGLFAAGF
jgi:hypothetical protein